MGTGSAAGRFTQMCRPRPGIENGDWLRRRSFHPNVPPTPGDRKWGLAPQARRAAGACPHFRGVGRLPRRLVSATCHGEALAKTEVPGGRRRVGATVVDPEFSRRGARWAGRYASGPRLLGASSWGRRFSWISWNFLTFICWWLAYRVLFARFGQEIAPAEAARRGGTMSVWDRLTGRKEPSGELRSQFSPAMLEELEVGCMGLARNCSRGAQDGARNRVSGIRRYRRVGTGCGVREILAAGENSHSSLLKHSPKRQ